MYHTHHHSPYYFTVFLLATVSYTPLLSHTDTLPNNPAFIEKLGNIKLREALQRLEKGKKVKNHTPTELLKMGMQEGDEMALYTTIYLVKMCRKRKLPIKKDAVMRYAIQHNASIKLITYLLENKIYSKNSLQGEVRYDLSLKFPFFRIIENEILMQKTIPKSISFVINIIGIVCLGLRIATFINIFRLASMASIEEWEYIGLMLKPTEWAINLLILTYYSSYKIGIKPGYLILALLSKRSKSKKEKLALLFLQHGADPNGRCFIIEYLPNTSKKRDIEMYYQLYKPVRAKLLYAMHLAIKYDLLNCVKQLETQGADLNPRAIYMEDKVDLSTNPPKIEFITLSELYHNKSKNTQYKYSLDFAKLESATYKYLRQKGLVPTKEIKEK